MNRNETEDTLIYTVVMDAEERYSIWPEYRTIPPGWQAVGKTGLRSECLDYIKEVWTDMRPLSLREYMAKTQEAATESSVNASQSRALNAEINTVTNGAGSTTTPLAQP